MNCIKFYGNLNNIKWIGCLDVKLCRVEEFDVFFKGFF